MLVFKKSKNDREYSHIECDFHGCDTVSPPASDLLKENLFQRGWFIEGGKHRCLIHFYDDGTAPGGLIERAADGSEGFVR